MVVKPDPIVMKRLRALHHLHNAFVRDNADAPFHPEEHVGSGDYNLHHVDIEADADAEWEFTQRGLAIVRGDLDDELDEILAQ